jgi:hypothetical protein
MTREERERYHELYNQGLDSYLEYSDFYAGDWLDEEESKEYDELFEKFIEEEL